MSIEKLYFYYYSFEIKEPVVFVCRGKCYFVPSVSICVKKNFVRQQEPYPTALLKNMLMKLTSFNLCICLSLKTIIHV